MSAPMFTSLGVWAWPAFIAFAAACIAGGVALKGWERRKGYRNSGDGIGGDTSGHHDGGFSDGGGGHH